MVNPWRYWTLRYADLTACAEGTGGYRERSLSLAQKEFQQWFPTLARQTTLSAQQERDIQTVLFSWFRAEGGDNLKRRAIAGLCLRCCVSHAIFRACHDLAAQFGRKYGFTTRDLLPLVLTDDGNNLMLVKGERATQAILRRDGTVAANPYQFFSVEILRKFDPARVEKKTVSDWAYLLTRQHPELRRVLAVEYGVIIATPWALLNQASTTKLHCLSDRDRVLIKVFHAVYRRDRRGKRGKCPDPSSQQLAEMAALLRERQVVVESLGKLLEELKKIADFLRDERVNPKRGQSEENNDSPTEPHPLEFLHPQLVEVLDTAIAQAVFQRLDKLKRSRRYAEFASRFLEGLRLIYEEGKSQSDVANLLGMSNQSQVSRVFKLSELIGLVRHRVKDGLFKVILKHFERERDRICADSQAFNNLLQQVEEFVDETVFQDAVREIKVGKSRNMNSLFARELCHFLEEYA